MTSANRRVRDDQNLLPLQPDLARSEGRSAFISLNDLLYAALNLAKIVHLGSLCGFSGLIFWPSEPRTQYVGVLRGHGTYLATKRKPVTDLWFRSLIHVHTWSSCAHERLHFKRKEFGRTWLLCWSTAHLHRAMKLKGWVKSNSQEALSLHIFTAGPSITGSSWIFLVGPSPAWSHPPPLDI